MEEAETKSSAVAKASQATQLAAREDDSQQVVSTSRVKSQGSAHRMEYPCPPPPPSSSRPSGSRSPSSNIFFSLVLLVLNSSCVCHGNFERFTNCCDSLLRCGFISWPSAEKENGKGNARYATEYDQKNKQTKKEKQEE